MPVAAAVSRSEAGARLARLEQDLVWRLLAARLLLVETRWLKVERSLYLSIRFWQVMRYLPPPPIYLHTHRVSSVLSDYNLLVKRHLNTVSRGKIGLPMLRNALVSKDA